MKAIISLAAMLIAVLLSSCASRPPLKTVPNVDLKRYEGTWYEIAKYPNFFQRSCAKNTSARYTAKPDGTIEVVNRCVMKNGESKQVIGQATVVPGSNNTKLMVGFGGPFKGAYWVIGLDEKKYSWALVGHPSRKFLWILSRTPKLSEAEYTKIIFLAESLGYDPSKLEPTIQSP